MTFYDTLRRLAVLHRMPQQPQPRQRRTGSATWTSSERSSLQRELSWTCGCRPQRSLHRRRFMKPRVCTMHCRCVCLCVFVLFTGHHHLWVEAGK